MSTSAKLYLHTLNGEVYFSSGGKAINWLSRVRHYDYSALSLISESFANDYGHS